MTSQATSRRTGDDAVMLPVWAWSEPARQANWLTATLYFWWPTERADFATGEDTWPLARARIRSWFTRSVLREDATGYGLISAPLLRAYLGDLAAPELDETGAREVVFETVDTGTETGRDPGLLQLRDAESPEAVAARRLRELTGLSQDKLGGIFGVSRATFFNWLNGTRPRGDHRDHLLRVAQLLEEAGRILGKPRQVGAWLLAPSRDSGRIPLELLKVKQYDLCKSLMTKKARVESLKLKHPTNMLSRPGLDDALKRLSPRPALEDYEGTAENQEGEDE